MCSTSRANVLELLHININPVIQMLIVGLQLRLMPMVRKDYCVKVALSKVRKRTVTPVLTIPEHVFCEWFGEKVAGGGGRGSNGEMMGAGPLRYTFPRSSTGAFTPQQLAPLIDHLT